MRNYMIISGVSLDSTPLHSTSIYILIRHLILCSDAYSRPYFCGVFVTVFRVAFAIEDTYTWPADAPVFIENAADLVHLLLSHIEEN